MEKFKITIIMPTYKRSKHIKTSIESCLNQSYKNIELIIIDDNDPQSDERQKTEEIINSFKDKRIKYLKMEKNSGACLARNKGLFSSTGQYVTFLDDDDEYYEKDSLKKSLGYMVKNNYDMIFGNLYMYNDENPKKSYYLKYKKDFEFNRKSLLTKHLVDIISGGISFMYKRDVLIQLNGFVNIPASQEYILLFNTIINDYKIGYFDHVCAIGHYYDNGPKITGSLKAIEAKKEVIKIIKPYLREISLCNRRKVMYRLNAFIFIGYLRRKSIKCIKYFIKLLPYIDLLVLSRFQKKKIVNQTLYR